MQTITLSTGQVSQIHEVGPGTRITSSGSGTVQWFAGSLPDAKNGGEFTDWPKGSAAGSADTLRRMCVRATATGSMTVTLSEGFGDEAPDDNYWDSDVAVWNADRTALVDPVTGETITHSRILANERPNFEVSGSTTETEAARIQIRGGLMKANSVLQITTLWQLDGADSKNLYMRAGDDATMTYGTSLRIGSYNGLTTQKTAGFTVLLNNNGSTGAQIAFANGGPQPFGAASTAVPVEVAVDTSLDWSIYLGATNSLVGSPVNKCILKSVIVEIK